MQLDAAKCLGQTLRRYTGLNHLAQAARAVLQNSAQINQVSNVLGVDLDMDHAHGFMLYSSTDTNAYIICIIDVERPQSSRFWECSRASKLGL